MSRHEGTILKMQSRTLGVLMLSLGLASAAQAATPTWTTLISSANPTLVGQSVTFTATVKVVGGGGPPTGSVTFKDAATVLGTAALDGSGKAAFTISALARGTHQITAIYSGDGAFSASRSEALAQSTPTAAPCSSPGFFPTANPLSLDLGNSASGDLNVDGKPDLVLVAPGDSSFDVMLGDGAGGFTTSAHIATASHRAPMIADFNLDGRPDLATLTGNAVQVLLGDGSGGFSSVGSTPLGGFSQGGAAVADFNLDGKPDVVAAAEQGTRGQLLVLLGDGNGGLTPGASIPTPFGARSVLAADLNLDGWPDLAQFFKPLGYMEQGNGDGGKVFLADGAGGFRAGSFVGGSSPIAKASDFNLDGKPDLVWLAEDGWPSTGPKALMVALGDGNGAFSTTSHPGSSSRPLGLPLGDFDLDGRPDVVWRGGIWRGSTTGLQQPSPISGVGSMDAVGDFNLDGFPDLVDAKGALLNNCASPASTTTLSASPSPSTSEQAVTLTASVTPATGPGTPTGQVQFRDGSNLLESPVTLANGVATLVTTKLLHGPHSLTAEYWGSSNFVGSTSAILSHTVLSRLSVDDVLANSATATTLRFTVSLSTASTLPVSVAYATSDGTAKAGADYVAASGTLTFAPGQTKRSVSVPLIQGASGPNKTFSVTLTGATNATFSRSVATGTLFFALTGAPTVSIGDAAVLEGSTGTTLLAFKVTLSRATSVVTVQFTTEDGTALAGADYTASEGRVDFLPGKTTRVILVPIASNLSVNGNRTLFVNLGVTSGGVEIARGQSTGTIIDDDPSPPATTIGQLRLYNSTTLEHLYTTDTNEYAVLGARGWVQEGPAYTMFRNTGTYGNADTVAIHRLYHSETQQHFWTDNWYEASELARGFGPWDYEGISGYVLPTQETGTTPLYRLSLSSPALHLWTTDANEKLVLSTQRGWVYEGILGYVIP
jgi:hypothetical protein